MLVKIKAQYQNARVARRRVEMSLLGTVLGEIENKAKSGKTFGDVEVIAVLKKMRESAETTLDLTSSDVGKEVLHEEIAILNALLPKQLSVDELKCIREKLGDVQLKDFMAHLKANYQGQYDGRIAAAVYEDMK